MSLELFEMAVKGSAIVCGSGIVGRIASNVALNISEKRTSALFRTASDLSASMVLLGGAGFIISVGAFIPAFAFSDTLRAEMAVKREKREVAKKQEKLNKLYENPKLRALYEKQQELKKTGTELDAELKKTFTPPQESPTVYVSGHRNAYAPFVLQNQGRVRMA